MIKTNNLKKRAITPAELEAIYGIPRGSAANMRWAKKRPRYFKAGPRRVIYMVEDVEEWLSRNPVLTMDSLKENE
jgi:predicted DNA-binding transcriptional regulator AlpA